MSRRKNRSHFFLIIFFCWVTQPLFLEDRAASTQTQFHSTYEITANAPAVNQNYAIAKEKARKSAMQLAIERALVEILGRENYQANRDALNNVLKEADRYVYSYRFIFAEDDEVEEVSRVKMEITLYTEELRKRLGLLGMLEGPADKKRIVLLINEKNLSEESEVTFWELKPISESYFVTLLQADGIQVVQRDSIRGLTSEETVVKAAQGDITSAVDIGLMTGAEIVIVGNAVSSILDENADTGLQPVQTSMSLKAISAPTATIIAAKSEFASAALKDPVEGEKEAFEKVSTKMAGFLLKSIRRYWDKDTEAPPAPPRPSTPPMPLTDL